MFPELSQKGWTALTLKEPSENVLQTLCVSWILTYAKNNGSTKWQAVLLIFKHLLFDLIAQIDIDKLWPACPQSLEEHMPPVFWFSVKSSLKLFPWSAFLFLQIKQCGILWDVSYEIGKNDVQSKSRNSAPTTLKRRCEGAALPVCGLVARKRSVSPIHHILYFCVLLFQSFPPALMTRWPYLVRSNDVPDHTHWPHARPNMGKNGHSIHMCQIWVIVSEKNFIAVFNIIFLIWGWKAKGLKCHGQK